MNRINTRPLTMSAILSGVALLALTPAMAAAEEAAAADASAASADTDEGDIIVTARKRAESIQNVPITMTAYTAKDLEARNISNIADLGNSTPGVAITSITGGTVLGIYLRGLAPANTANDLNVDANVGVFIDGIYQTSRNTLDIISVLSPQQIEIVKGPQSALYGRSTFAGALSIATQKPTREFQGSATATVGQDEDYRVRAAVSGPLGETVSAALSAGYLTYDGYGTNTAAPKDNLGGTEKYAVTAALQFDPTDSFRARLSGLITHSSTEFTPTTLLPISSFNCGTVSTSPLAAGLRQLYCGPQPVSENSSLTPNGPNTVAKNRQVSLDMSWNFGPATLVSLTGYTNSNQRAFNDYDGTASGVTLGVCTVTAACLGGPYTRLTTANAISTSIERVHTFTQELRLQSDDTAAFTWMFGGNYFDSKIPIAAGGIGVSTPTALAATERLVAVTQIATPPAAGTGAYEFTANPFLVADSNASQVFSSYSASSTKSKSVFGSLGYKLGDFRVRAEGRYNEDKKQAQVFTVPANATSAPGINQPIPGTSVPAAGTFPLAGVIYQRKFKSFAPRFTADWQAMPDLLLYASAAKGIRSGGFNTANPANGAANGILPSEAAYDEETNWTYEGGVKSKWMDGRLLFNASVFHIDWKNAQVSGFTQNPAATTVNRIVLNIGNIKATGFEVQTEYKFTDMFSVGGNLSYSDPKFATGTYDGGQIATCVIGVGAAATAAPGCPPVIVVTRANGTTAAVPSLAGQRPQRSVKTQWNLHATVDAPITGDWNATARVDVNHSGSQFNNLINTQTFGKRTLVNLRIGANNERYSLALFANNLFDKAYVQNAINQPRIGAPFTFSIPEIYLGETRRIGLTGTVKF